MGLDINAARFLLAEKARGVRFGRTLTLGRQALYMNKKQYQSVMASADGPLKDPVHADHFMDSIGAEPLLAMDFSDYEGAQIIHDANEPIGDELKNSFDTVIDGGTLEHVFNFPVALRNCMEMVKTGGQLVLMTPWHNYSGHGFYQFSPELMHNVLADENGYRVEKMLIAAEGSWYAVKNPGELKRRIEIVTRDPVLLYVTARRVSASPVFTRWPQQSDYSSAWERGTSANDEQAAALSLKSRLVNQFPFVENIQSDWRDYKRNRSLALARNPGFERLCSSGKIPY